MIHNRVFPISIYFSGANTPTAEHHMSSDEQKDKPDKDKSAGKKSAKQAFSPGKAKAPGDKPAFFMEDELDIFCNKMTHESFVFHGKEIDYRAIDHLIYDHDTYTVDVVMKNGDVYDLGVKIQWLIRPYFTKSDEVQFMRTRDGEPIDGHFYPLIHKK
ncbi:MAG: hypothetical protein KTR28_01940 [Micavibrio sp.]|nr:hypothetical protein [Micavibrio sp.]